MPLRLSVLDQSPIPEEASGADALRNTVDLARHVEALGYHRYWVAEHHGTPMLASAAPEVLIAAIASSTTRLRVGSGGVMLPHYSPFKVAETFSILSGLYGDRIDLGLGRASGTDPTTTLALQRDRRVAAPDDFPSQLAELLAYVDDALPSRHPFAKLAQLPGRPGRPQPWLLGSSPQSGIWAAEAGLPYAFADFIQPTGASIAERYRSEFLQSAFADRPEVMVAVTAICAETDEEARRVAASAKMVFTLFREGVLVPVPPIEKALAFLAARAPEGALGRGPLAAGRRGVVGTPSAVRAGLEAVAAEYGADEVMVVTITHRHEDRRRSYELIAGAFAGG